jgi:beta-lactam-binding protein with PASTA domain
VTLTVSKGPTTTRADVENRTADGAEPAAASGFKVQVEHEDTTDERSTASCSGRTPRRGRR